MINIRIGTFETNSSSVHTLVMCNDKQWKDFYFGNLVLMNSRELLTLDEFLQKIKDNYGEDLSGKSFNEIQEWCNEEGYDRIDNLDTFLDNEYFETYHDSYTTDKGDVVHAFGIYGQDY